MTRDEAEALWGRVQANQRALAACEGPHRFADITPDKTFGKRYRCAACGGEVESMARSWYERGLAHGDHAAKERERSRVVKLIEEDIAYYTEAGVLDTRQRALVDGVLRALSRTIDQGG